jgi:predicted DNA-binding transcriptional regulator AlpA
MEHLSNFSDLPPELAGKRVLQSPRAAAFVGLSYRQWKRLRAEGKTPPTIELGPRTYGHTLESLLAWIEARKAVA